MGLEGWGGGWLEIGSGGIGSGDGVGVGGEGLEWGMLWTTNQALMATGGPQTSD